METIRALRVRTKRKVYEISSDDETAQDTSQKPKLSNKTMKTTKSPAEKRKLKERPEKIKKEPSKTPKVDETESENSNMKLEKKVKPNANTKPLKTEVETFPDGTEIKYIDPRDVKFLKEEMSNKKAKHKKTLIKVEPTWQEYEIIKQEHKIAEHTARNIVELFKEGNTIPFIARYRKDAVGHLTADELRDIKSTYENINDLKQKVVSAYNKIKDLGKMNMELEANLLAAQNAETLEEIYGPYKPAAGEASLKRQIHMSLEEPANSILKGTFENLASYVGCAKGLDDVKLVHKHVIAVVAKKISTSPTCLQYIQKMRKEARCTLQTKKINKRTQAGQKEKHDKSKDASNFTDYYDRSFSTQYLKPHQIMAINRAEHLKFINVTLSFSDFIKHFCYETRKDYLQAARGKMAALFETAMLECYNNIVIPLLKRMKRSELKSYAEKASLDIFNRNLKQTLLAAPVNRKSILGVDPGFAHGCKLGVISPAGDVLSTRVVYPHSKMANAKKRLIQEEIFRELLLEHECSLIALGNGTACRETEAWITDMMSRGWFAPLQVSYTIVNESGASIYSCSKEAVEEFPTLDPNLISAVSLARRVQDPLSELVKVEPQHLGIGMYQHDVNQKRLEEVLNDVVSECVSFVGVDINTASKCLLKHVAGLSERRAEEIIAHRQRSGAFQSRDELLQIKGIGPLTFKQCAGFLKIPYGSIRLDATIVHPESYHIANAIISHLRLRSDQIGTDAFIKKVQMETPALLAGGAFNTSKENLELILEGLSRPLEYDLRDEGFSQPLFRQGVTDLQTLQVGMTLTGAVNNCTSFGSFVDIGVGVNGLLHVKRARNVLLQVGDRVEVKIANLELERKRIGLELVMKL